MHADSLSTEQRKEIHEVLARFGLGHKDSLGYIQLLGSGPSTVSPFATSMNVPVSTAQSILKRLVDAGLVDVTARRSRSVYQAYDPVILKRILERSLQELDSAIPLLQSLKTETSGPAKVRVYQGERVADILHRALKAKSGIVYEIVSANDFQKTIGERFHFSRRRIKAGIRLKSLRVEAYEIKKYSRATHERELREARFLPRELHFTSSIMFWDTTVTFFSSSAEGIAVTFDSESITLMVKQLFELLWTISRKMETA